MRASNFALRLQPSLMEEAKALAKEEGVALNQLINVAVAEKLATKRTLAFFERYTGDADVSKALALLQRPRIGEPPRPGDELPEKDKVAGRREKRVTVSRALKTLCKAGTNEPPREGDELPESWTHHKAARKPQARKPATRSK